MPTAQTIIDNALISLGVLRPGYTPSTIDRTDAFGALNRIIDQWNTDRLLVTTIQQVSYQLSSSAQSYTLGPSGADLTGPRPQMIEAAQSRQSNADGQFTERIDLISAQEWRDIADKTLRSNLPQKLYYQPTNPNGTLFLWPTPNSTSTYLDLDVWVVLAAFPDLATTPLTLFPGYERPLTLTLAAEMQPRIPGAVLSDETKRELAEAMQTLKAYNASFPSVPKPEVAQ